MSSDKQDHDFIYWPLANCRSFSNETFFSRSLVRLFSGLFCHSVSIRLLMLSHSMRACPFYGGQQHKRLRSKWEINWYVWKLYVNSVFKHRLLNSIWIFCIALECLDAYVFCINVALEWAYECVSALFLSLLCVRIEEKMIHITLKWKLQVFHSFKWNE